VKGYSKGRVIFINTEYRGEENQITSEGDIVITIQLVASRTKLSQEILDMYNDLSKRELVLVNITLEITLENVRYRVDVSLDWEYIPFSEEYDIADLDNRFFIQRIVNPEIFVTKAIRYTHPVYRDLEIR
jgi:hypothetical protein